MDIRVSFQNINHPRVVPLIQRLIRVKNCGIGILSCAGDRKIVINRIPAHASEPMNIKVIRFPQDVARLIITPPQLPGEFDSTHHAERFVLDYLQAAGRG